MFSGIRDTVQLFTKRRQLYQFGVGWGKIILVQVFHQRLDSFFIEAVLFHKPFCLFRGLFIGRTDTNSFAPFTNVFLSQALCFAACSSTPNELCPYLSNPGLRGGSNYTLHTQQANSLSPYQYFSSFKCFIRFWLIPVDLNRSPINTKTHISVFEHSSVTWS